MFSGRRKCRRAASKSGGDCSIHPSRPRQKWGPDDASCGAGNAATSSAISEVSQNNACSALHGLGQVHMFLLFNIDPPELRSDLPFTALSLRQYPLVDTELVDTELVDTGW